MSLEMLLKIPFPLDIGASNIEIIQKGYLDDLNYIGNKNK